MKKPTIGYLFRELRRELKLSQKHFGAFLGLHQTAISRIEFGMQLPSVEEFAVAFRIAMKSNSEGIFQAFEKYLYEE